MQKAFITHNPYKVITTIEVNGESPQSDSKLIQFLYKNFNLWVNQIPTLLGDEYNDDVFDITFKGIEQDYQDLLSAIKSAEKIGMKFTIKKIDADEYDDKEEKIRRLFDKIKKLGLPALENVFNLTLNGELEICVTSTMSAGKSTLINALLGQKLMPSKQGACTATITRIKDDDDKTFKATAFDANCNELGHYSVLDYKIMSALNSNPEVSEIHVSGDIPFVTSDEASLVLIDTPSPSNARNANHKIVTNRALNQSSKSLVLFVMNGCTLNDTAQDYCLKQIVKSMSAGDNLSGERFMFIINKLDDYSEECGDDIPSDVIENVTEYLEEMGIKEPNIFPAAALPALLIRRYKKCHDDDEKHSILRNLKPIAEKLIEEHQLHLEKYPKLDSNSQAKINMELQEAIESDDIFGQVLIHTGIRGIEEAIRTYVAKYGIEEAVRKFVTKYRSEHNCSKAEKITDIVNTLKSELEDIEKSEKAKKDSIAEEINTIIEHIDILESEIINEKQNIENVNTTFKSKISSLRSSTDLYIDFLSAKFSSYNFRKSSIYNIYNYYIRMNKNEANEYILKFVSKVDGHQDELQAEINQKLNEDVEMKVQELLNDYVNSIAAINEECSINMQRFKLTPFKVCRFKDIVDINKVIEEASQGEYHSDFYGTEERFTTEYKIKSLLNSQLEELLSEEQRKFSTYADMVIKKIDKYLYDLFDKVNRITKKKEERLSNVIASKAMAKKSLKQSNNKLAQFESIKQELDAILEI